MREWVWRDGEEVVICRRLCGSKEESQIAGINKSINTHAGCVSDPLRKSFEFATLKAEHERMKKIIRGKATGGCVAVFALVFFDAGFRGLSLLDS
jgi:hypothetical protein